LSIEDEKPDILEMITVVSLSVEQLAEYVGDYVSAELQVTYRLKLQDSHLYVQHRSAPTEPLRPGFSDMFWVAPFTLRFTRDGAGRVAGFTVDADRARHIHFVRL
jgi:hypothetical protein